jgi:hypothetical protein
MAKKKLTAQEEAKVKDLKTSIEFHGKGTREAVRNQNDINAIFGVGPRRDWTNLPTAKQMKIAESGKKQVLAENKASNKAAKVDTKGATKGGTDIASILSGSLNTKSSKDYEKERTTKHKKTLKQMLGGM